VTVVLDTSAVLAMLWDEPGGERAAELLGEAWMSTVNVAELVAKLIDRGGPPPDVREVVTTLGIHAEPFDLGQALAAGLMRGPTRSLGLSLGDRACLALAGREGVVAVTADRAWAQAAAGAEVEVIR
jgi:PIN domain nuclease of toxin-antitoxin system